MVKVYNMSIRGFLESIVAQRMNLARKAFFEAEKAAAKAPEVKF